jgi:hypothetical protein
MWTMSVGTPRLFRPSWSSRLALRFCWGYDLAPLLDAGERRSVDDFARLALGEADDPTTSRLLRNGPPRWRAVEGGERLEAVIGAFQSGLDVIPGDR